MQLLNLTEAVWVYLPYDNAPIPFGAPYTDISSDDSTFNIWTVVGYLPTNGDRVQLYQGAGGTLDPAFTAGQLYYVVSASGDTFKVSATSGGSAIAGAAQSTGVNVIVVKSANALGPVQPFKPGASAVALNLTADTMTLYGTADTNQAAPGQGYNPPAGPNTGAKVEIAAITAGSAAIVQLNYDWIEVTGSGAGLVLLQN